MIKIKKREGDFNDGFNEIKSIGSYAAENPLLHNSFGRMKRNYVYRRFDWERKID